VHRGPGQEKRSYIMSRVRSKGSRIEQSVAPVLDSLGQAYQQHVAALPGKPDFVLTLLPVAIFVDSCFWHGCTLHCRMPKSNADYWVAKIDYNRRRDNRQRSALRRRGWIVVRLWEHDLAREAAVRARIAAGMRRASGRARPA